jgi:signal transduction histidine kinase
MKFPIFFCVLLLLFIAVHANAQSPFVVTEEKGQLSVSKEGSILVFIDSSGGKLPVGGIASVPAEKFRPLETKTYILKNSKAAQWFSIVVNNTGSKNASLVLDLGDPYIDRIMLYQKDADFTRLIDTAGALNRFGQRPLTGRNFAFPISIPAHTSTSYLLKVKNTYHHIFIRINVFTLKAYESSILREYLVWGILTGVLIFVFIFSMVIFLVEKNQLYFFFSLYVLATIVWIWSNNGLGYQFIWNNYPQAMIRVRFMAGVLTVAALVQSMQSFIGQHSSNSRFYRGTNIVKILLIILAVVLLVPYTFNDDEFLITLFIITGDLTIILAVVFLFASLVEKMRQGFRPALYYLVSTMVLLVSIVLLILARMDIVAPVFVAVNGNYIGILLQVLILSVGHIQRYQQYRREKEQAIVQMVKQEQETILQVTLAKENERNRIAADMHDELGAGISSLRLIGELAERKDSLPEIKNDIERFTLSAKDLGQKVRDIVWTLNPENDTLANFIYYIHRYGQKLFEDTTISFDMGIPPSIPDVVLPGEKRKHLLLVIKEAFTNILKHSGASSVLVAVGFEGHGFQLRIKDNGRGIKAETNSGGNGLRNMHKRMEEIGGAIQINNDSGTSVILAIYISS